MPNINEFFKKRNVEDSTLEKFDGVKPCSKCEENSSVYFWDQKTFTMTWVCNGGHSNEVKVNV